MTHGASSVRLGRFKPMKIKEMMHGVLHDKLQGVTYSSENVSQLTKEISEDIKNGLKGAFGLPLLHFEQPPSGAGTSRSTRP